MTLIMVENIRRIGIFMIVAQTVMHFAAGKQYEKYMKVITGVIILLMFVGPFVDSSGSIAANWQEEAGRLERQLEENMWQEMPYAANPLETVALSQIEEEVRGRLNDAIPDNDCRVTNVSIDLERAEGASDAGTGSGERNWVFRCVKVTLESNWEGGAAEERGGGMIRIDEITVEHEPREETEQEDRVNEHSAKMREYQHIFAQTLGIADDRVEVIYRGWQQKTVGEVDGR